KYGPIDRARRRADIAIMIGDRAVWGRGVGAEATYLVSRYLFVERGLARIDAGSCNPAFVRMVVKLGWRVEAGPPERVRIGGELLPYTRLAQTDSEFRRRPAFEPACPPPAQAFHRAAQ
ncbi:MAG: GNAT family protein, partial [Alphaproteobacteria bacterium]|nr:GNAT family protein [Alphaproteobacteria bacterium]